MLDLGDIPRLEKAALTNRITIAIDETIKRDLMQLKYQYGIDTAEWIRSLIRREIFHVKEACEKSV
jgi:hypothetical protein